MCSCGEHLFVLYGAGDTTEAVTGDAPDLLRPFDDGSFERHLEASGRTEPDCPRQNKPDSDLPLEN